MRSKIAQQLRFHVPTFTFTYQAHRHQFTVATTWFRPWSLEEWGQLFGNVIYNTENVQAKIVKIVYHWHVLLFDWLGLFISNLIGEHPSGSASI
jgi:hypothetical protein